MGATVVTANAKGRYRAVVDARGVMSVEGFLTRGMLPAHDHLVELDGRRAHTADLEYIDDGP